MLLILRQKSAVTAGHWVFATVNHSRIVVELMQVRATTQSVRYAKYALTSSGQEKEKDKEP